MDVVLLSRLQFAITIMFHYLFPPLTIGMGIVLVYLEANYLRTKDPLYETAARFWTKIFALNFAIGVATGIVMEFQFGTNWSPYSRFVGDVFGSPLAAEGIFAFFLESGFLAVLVFGWDRVSPRMHFFSTIMVALGSIFSSIWIVIANSWQQTPAGHHVVQMTRDGRPWFIDSQPVLRAEILNFWEVVFNPSTMHRLVHVWIGCFIMGAFFVMSISAYYLLRNRHVEFARRSFTGALLLGAISSVAILVSGHFQANNVYETQPAKLAAFEGHYQTGAGDLNIIGWPDDESQQVKFKLAVPGGLSMMLHGESKAEIAGLDRFRPVDRPPVLIPFMSYHLMVAFGMFFIAITILSVLLLVIGKLYRQRWLLAVFVIAVVPAVLANQFGWVAAEVGRQPWIVHPPVQWQESGELVVGADGYVQYEPNQGLRTADAVSTNVEGWKIVFSIVGFSLIYLLLAAIWLFVLNDKIHQGPEPVGVDRKKGGAQGLMQAAASLASHTGSMTETHE